MKELKDHPDIEFSAQVLTAGSWPDYKSPEVRLPEEVNYFQEHFRQFYLNKHNSRRLTWQPALGTCVVRANFPKGRRELDLSCYQAAVLYLFNEADTLTYGQIRDQSQLDEKELTRTLQSLACPTDPSVRVLLKEPKAKNVEANDVFTYNAGFRHKLFRIKINQVQMKETKEDQQQTTQRVFADRQYAIDACLVRIMKARKSLTHNQLMAECMQQLKFPTTVADVKKRIGGLIEREYIERDADNSQVYNYVA